MYCKQTEGSATWGNNPCQVVCPHETSSNIAWPQTVAGTTANGTCNAGYTGSPTRACLLNGSWSTTNAGATCTGKPQKTKKQQAFLSFAFRCFDWLFLVFIFSFPSLATSSNNSVGAIVGPIVGVLCFLALVIGVAIFLRRRKQEKGLEAFTLD